MKTEIKDFTDGGSLMVTRNNPALPPDNKRLLRHALGLFPTGVAVVTSTTWEGERLGATVSSFSSVSLDPPLVLFSMARIANSFEAWRCVETFAVNILDELQTDISSRFSRPKSDKWSGLEPQISKITGAPLLLDALAWFECRTWARYDGGDHVIFVGEIVSYAHRTGEDVRPLVFFASNYTRLENSRQNLDGERSFLSLKNRS